jgi:hypothetical protein
MKNLKNILMLLGIASCGSVAAEQKTTIEVANHYNKKVAVELWRADELDNRDFEPVYEGTITVPRGQMARLEGSWNEGFYELDYKAKGIKRNASHKFKIAHGGQQLHFEVTEKGNMKPAGAMSQPHRAMEMEEQEQEPEMYYSQK